MAGFDLFGNAQKKDIRVGYISTDRGYVSNVSIFEANRYAKLQPGTQFIVANRDKVLYLNINEVNALKPEDVIPSNDISACGGIDGIDPSLSLGNVNKIEVNFLGGGGVGAQGNAVVGNDGSILAVDLIHGGFGYKYPPLVEIKDTYGLATKINAQAFLGSTATVLETYTDEDEFENLDLETLIPNFEEDKYGVRLDPVNGEIIGDWNPNDYANYFQDPIRSEIKKYQEFVQRKSTGTWWDTRTQRPISIVGEDKNNNVFFPVDHWAWGGELLKPEKNTGLVPVEFSVYGQGSEKNRDLKFFFEAEDGSHSFTVKGVTHSARSGKYRKVIKKVRVNTTYIVTSENRKKIKNIDRAIEQGLVREEGGKSVESGPGKGKVIFADYVDSRNDNDDIQLTALRGKFKSKNKQKVKGREGARDDGGTRNKSTYDLTYRLSFRDPTKRNPIEVVEETFMNKYAISPVPESEAEGSAHVGKVYTFVWQEYFPYDGEYTFNALADSFSTITFSNSDGTLWDFKAGQIKGLQKNRKDPISITKTVREGLYTITASLENSGPDETEIVVEPPPVVIEEEEEPKEVDYKLSYLGLHPVNNKLNVSGDRKSIKFRDGDGSDTNSTLEILSGDAVFSDDGNKLIGTGSVKIRFSWKDDPNNAGLAVEQIQIFVGDNDVRLLGSNRNFKDKSGQDTDTFVMKSKKSSSKKSKKVSSSPGSIFDTQSYIDKADRKLYRAKPILGKNVSGFFNKYAVLPFDPQGEKIKTVSEEPKVSFDSSGGKLFLKVSGSGRVKVDFRMKVNDNLVTSGLAVREVSIENDGDLLKLVRSITEEAGEDTGDDDNFVRLRGLERETITGSAEFTAGKSYAIKQIGGSPTSGFGPVDKTTIGFDDNIDNGYDENAALDITNVKVIEQEKEQSGKSVLVSTDSYSGEHLIRWEKVEFPQDGNYTIKASADDSAKILIGNISGEGMKKIGNGLKSREKRGGDEYIMQVNGTNTKTETAFFVKGSYRVRVELTQKPGKTIQSGNPMGIAIDILAGPPQEEEFQNLESWQENPMGLALTIKAPKAPVPKETPPPQLGRCPNNPMWTTRFTQGGQEEKWYPVYDSRWGKFMNRFAMSPVKPLSSPESSESGKPFTKVWNIDIPYDGFYGVKGSCDNTGTITVGNETFKLDGFKRDDPTLNKVFLTEGNTTIAVTVENEAQQSFIKTPKLIFDTADWVENAEEIDVDIIDSKILCHAGGGFGGKSSGRQTKVGKVKVGKGGKGGKGDGEIDGSRGGDGGGAGLRNGRNARSGTGGTIDGGYGVNFEGTERGERKDVQSSGDDGGYGGDYGGGGAGHRDKGVAGNGAKGGVKIVWGSTGKSQTWTKPGRYEVLVPQTEPGKLNRTSVRATCIGGGGSGYTDRGETAVEVVTGRGEGETFFYDSDGTRREIKIDTEIKEKMIKGGGGGSGGAYAYAKEKLPAGTRLEIVVGRGGVAPEDEGSADGEDSYVKVLTTVIDKEADRPRKIKGKGKIRYIGPLITSYKKKGLNPKDHLGPYLSPFFAFGRQATEEIQGRKWTFRWENVDFPIDGRYTFRSEADDKMIIRVDDKKFQTTEVFENIEEKTKKFTKGKKTIEIILENSNQPGTNFVLNPVYCGLEILANVPEEIKDQSSWKKNPVGASAILIPPPCPQEIGGVGIVTDVVINTPGVGYSGTGGVTYPVAVILDSIIIDNPGINYNPTDPIIITTDPADFGSSILPNNVPINPPGMQLFEGDTSTPPGGGGFGMGDGFSTIPGGSGSSGPGEGGPGGGSNGEASTGGGGDGTGAPVAGYDPNVPGPPSVSGGGTADSTGAIPGTNAGIPGALVSDEVSIDEFGPGGGLGGAGTDGSAGGVGGEGGGGDGRQVLPGSSTQLNLILGPFGSVVGIDVVNPGQPFTKTPDITILSDTGVNAVLRPKFRIVRDPVGPQVNPETLIQVTDLVGLKQTGYIDGRAYYGQVFIKNGLRYAGVYETVGDLVRVYDTLQESITGEVTTRPSAILRQGTDIQSNNPGLNLPGTPDNII